MPTIRQTVEEYLKSIIEEVKKDQLSKNIKASGKSANSFRVEVRTDIGTLYGSDYVEYQERGRGPGGLPPIQSIEEWIRVKGITPQSGSVEGMAYAIAKKIAKNGTDIYIGRRPGLSFSEIVERNKPKLVKDLLKGTKETVISALRKR